MELYLDTAILAEIREVASWGVLSGVTTNPSLLAKAGLGPKQLMDSIKGLVEGPMSLEVIAEDEAAMAEEGRKLRQYGDNVVVKLPLTAAGLKACATLRKEGIPTNLTLVFSANQALLAARAGATYVSPFIGRLNDCGGDGNEVVAEIRQIFDTYGFTTKIIAASIRGPADVTAAALNGADIATVPYGVIKKMVSHPLTDAGIDRFLADWQKSGHTL